MADSVNGKVDLLRHTVATLAYRGGKAVRGAPASFSGFQAAPGVRTPGQIRAHMGDLMDWALAIAKGNHTWHDSEPRSWDEDSARFFAALQALDDYFASGAPIRAENYFRADIAAGRVGAEQIPPKREFD